MLVEPLEPVQEPNMIDILIPYYKTPDYLENLLNSLKPNDLINKVIISDGDVEPRRYFSANVNHGFHEVESEFFVILNSDTKVDQANWLDVLLKTSKEHPEYGILSPWGVFYEEPCFINKTIIEEQKYIGAFCWYMRSSLFSELGMFRTDGKYAHWNSDFEFCDRVYTHGLKVGWAPTTIKHKGGASGQPAGIPRY